MNLEWLTYQWFIDNFYWIVCFLVVATIILFIFPVMLSYDLYKKDKEIDDLE